MSKKAKIIIAVAVCVLLAAGAGIWYVLSSGNTGSNDGSILFSVLLTSPGMAQVFQEHPVTPALLNLRSR